MAPSSPLTRIALVGAGFWSSYQLAAWAELPGVEVVAIANRTSANAEKLASRFGIRAVYDDLSELLAREDVDAIDIVTDVSSHRRFVELGAAAGVAVICQKPMAPTLEDASAMVGVCADAGVPFVVHENFRWQAPLRALADELRSGVIGSVFRARLSFCSSFPVFENQPFLAREERFILADVGSHLLDVARFLFGEADALYCQTARVNPAILGEDVATVVLHQAAVTCMVELSYASRLEHERFPETFALLEGERGSIELAPDGWLRVTTDAGTHARRIAVPRYAWADPAYDLVHSSIVPCHADALRAVRRQGRAETDGADNLETLRLVDAAYRSAGEGGVVALRGASRPC